MTFSASCLHKTPFCFSLNVILYDHPQSYHREMRLTPPPPEVASDGQEDDEERQDVCPGVGEARSVGVLGCFSTKARF